MPRGRTPRNSQHQSPAPSTPRTPRARRASPRQIELDLSIAAAQKEKERRRALRIESIGKIPSSWSYLYSKCLGTERRAAREKEKEQDARNRRALDDIVTGHLNRSGSGNSNGNGVNEQPSQTSTITAFDIWHRRLTQSLDNDTAGADSERAEVRPQGHVGPQVRASLPYKNIRRLMISSSMHRNLEL